MNELLSAFASQIKPRDNRPTSEWARENVILHRSTDSASFQPEFTPWWPEVFEEIRDNSNKVISILAPTGAGKSTLLEVMACDILTRDPGPMMIAAQTDDDVEEWAEEGLFPTMKSCGPLIPKLPTRRGTWKKAACLIEGAPVHLTGANVSGTQSKSKRWVFLDEAWLAREGRIGDLERRLHNRWNGRLVLMGQAGFLETDEDGELIGDDWTLIHHRGEQRQWGFTCPECNTWQPYSFDALWFPDEGEIGERVRDIRMGCQNDECSAEWEDTVENRRELSECASWSKTRDRLFPDLLSFHLDAVALWRNPWQDEVLEHLSAEESHARGRSKPKEQVTQKRRARPWSRFEQVDRGDIDYHESKVADYRNGEEIPGEFRRFLLVDTQQDHFWALVRAFDSEGGSLALTFQKVSTEAGIEDLRRRYKVEPFRTYVDAGYETSRVYALCARFGYRALKGEGVESYSHYVRERGGKKVRVQREISELTQATSKTGEKCSLQRMAATPLKDILARMRAGKGARWQAVSDIDPRWSKFLDSELREESGWKQIKRDNHSWDLEYYAIGAALIWRALK